MPVGNNGWIISKTSPQYMPTYQLNRDVALLAESPDDAKARAEADLRRGDQFEDIQDSWPEEIVSVEALAVEPYPELE